MPRRSGQRAQEATGGSTCTRSPGQRGLRGGSGGSCAGNATTRCGSTRGSCPCRRSRPPACSSSRPSRPALPGRRPRARAWPVRGPRTPPGRAGRSVRARPHGHVAAVRVQRVAPPGRASGPCLGDGKGSLPPGGSDPELDGPAGGRRGNPHARRDQRSSRQRRRGRGACPGAPARNGTRQLRAGSRQAGAAACSRADLRRLLASTRIGGLRPRGGLRLSALPACVRRRAAARRRARSAARPRVQRLGAVGRAPMELGETSASNRHLAGSSAAT